MKLTEWIEAGKDLPTLSDAVISILKLIDDEKTTTRQIAQVIKRDVSLSGRILKVANSSLFGFRQKISTIDQASVALGSNSIRNMALSLSVLNLLQPEEKKKLSRLWQSSLLVGTAAREFSKLQNYSNTENAFTAGLLHDIGMIAMYKFDPEKALQLFKIIEEKGRPSLEYEKKLFGIDHQEAGRLLASTWKLPKTIADVISFHHFASGSNGDEILHKSLYLGALAGDIFFAGRKRTTHEQYTNDCEKLLGLASEESEKILQNLHEKLTEIAMHFDIEVDSDLNYEEMLRKANEELVKINLSSEAMKLHLKQAIKRERLLTAQLTEANKKLSLMAIIDSLTGLYNRMHFNETIQKEWKRTYRYGRPVTFIMLDVDHFKKVNDTYGHLSGDIVLKTVAKTIKEKTRDSDFVARYGGEEFAIILTETPLKNGIVAAEKIRQAIESKKIKTLNDKTVKVTVSCGVATVEPQTNIESPEKLIDKADKALYKAKNTGRNKVVVIK